MDKDFFLFLGPLQRYSCARPMLLFVTLFQLKSYPQDVWNVSQENGEIEQFKTNQKYQTVFRELALGKL